MNEETKSNIKLYEKLGYRFFLSWCITALLFAVFNFSSSLYDIEYVTTVDTKLFVILFVAVVIVLTYINAVSKKWYTDVLGCAFVVPLYTIYMMFNKINIYMCFAITVFIFILAAYTFNRFGEHFENLKIGKITCKFIILMAVIFFICYLMMLTVVRYLSFKSPCYDFGIFSQAFYYMKNTFIPYTTCERGELLSHFKVHMSPILYVLLPAYIVFPTPATLIVSQVLLLAAAVLPLYLICRHRKLSNLSTMVVCLAYILYPAVGGGLFYDFHENKFLPLLIFWFIYFMEKKKAVPSIIMMLLVCFVKEDAPIYVGCISFYYIFAYEDKKDKLRAFRRFAFALVYFFAVVAYLQNFGDGAMTSRFSNFLVDKEDSIIMMLINIIKNPAYFFSELLSTSKLEFFLWTMLPLGFVPFLTKKLRNYILILPYLLMHFVSSYVYQHNIFFQYTYGSLSLLLFMTVLYFSENNEEKIKRRNLFISFMMVFGVLLTFTSAITTKHYYLSNYVVAQEERQRILESFESIIPPDASVEASSYYVTPLSSRDEIYEIGTERLCDYVVYDLRILADEERIAELQAIKESLGYEIIFELDGLVRILESPMVHAK